MQKSQIEKFWLWFQENSFHLQSDKYPNSFLSELDRIIIKWELSWEVGPGINVENSFTISPNGNKSLLDKTKEIISFAPSILNWEFYYAKQPKVNWHLAKLTELNIDIEATEWEYVLFKYDDEKVEILLKADSLSGLDNDTTYNTVDLVLANLLGEELFLNKIDFIEVVDSFDSDDGTTKLKYLPKHLLTI